MISRFDHAVTAVRDLDAAMAHYPQVLGLDVYPGGRHTGLGTHNAIVRFGLDYVELIGVYDRTEVLAAGYRRASLAHFLDKAQGLVGFCLAADDLDALAERFRRTGLDAMGPLEMQRMRPDGALLRWRLLVPGETSWRRPWPFFIQWEMRDEERLAVETPGEHPLGVRRIAGVHVAVRDLAQAMDLYGRQLGLACQEEETLLAVNARRARFGVGDFAIDLLSPLGPGPIQSEIEQLGEGPYAVVLQVDSVEQAAAVLARSGVSLQPAAESAGAWLIPPEHALGARLLLVE